MDDMTKWIAITGVVTVVIIGGILFAAKGQQSTSTGSVGTPPAVTDSDWSQGSVTAPVTLIEYGDFQCPFCATFEPLVEQLRREHPDQVRFVYRYFPLPQHAQAEITTRAAEAAGKQGKFWEMHDKLFATQNDWAEKTNAQDIITGYAQNLGLNVDQFKTDLFADTVTTKITNAKSEASSLNLPGTPSLFVNGTYQATPPTTYADLLKLVHVQ